MYLAVHLVVDTLARWCGKSQEAAPLLTLGAVVPRGFMTRAGRVGVLTACEPVPPLRLRKRAKNPWHKGPQPNAHSNILGGFRVNLGRGVVC